VVLPILALLWVSFSRRSVEGETGEWARQTVAYIVVVLLFALTGWGLLQGAYYIVMMVAFGVFATAIRLPQDGDLLASDRTENAMLTGPPGFGRNASVRDA
jgi:hypothetical protein